MSLFDTSPIASAAQSRQAPLAERMRPHTLEDYVGQEHLLAPGKPLRVAIENDDATSMIFWGPPGTGKTTLAKIIAQRTQASFIEFSAVLSGIKEIKQVMVDAEKASHLGSRTILFVDEIHRFNKAQQDAFLPYVERGTIRLIGATTENPSFEIIAALLSRCRVYTLVALTEDQIVALLRRALADTDRGLGSLSITAEDDALATIASYSLGDARNALNALDVSARLVQGRNEHLLTRDIAAEALQRRVLLYDKHGEQHYDIISALHKSVRNSDADAALYWLGRMLEAGEDPMYVARRVVRMAVEDIGLAAPEALNLCLSAKDAMHFLGHPEGELRTGAGRCLPRTRTKIECSLHRVQHSTWRHSGHCRGTCPPAPAQRPDQADEGTRLRQRLPIRPRRRRPGRRHGVSATLTRRTSVLPPDERGPRKIIGSTDGRDRAHQVRKTQIVLSPCTSPNSHMDV